MKYTTYLALIGQASASTTENEAYTNSFEDCKAFAARFDNTCGDQTTQLTYANVPTADMSCSNAGTTEDSKCPAHDTSADAALCEYTRKLCVTCVAAGDDTTIRVQSNNIPSHCVYSPKVSPVEEEIDYSATWLPAEADSVIDANNAMDQSAIDALICSATRSASTAIPAASNFVQNSGTDNDKTWGVSVSGMMIFSAINSDGLDPFYPSEGAT
jgi:hypothetical protein